MMTSKFVQRALATFSTAFILFAGCGQKESTTGAPPPPTATKPAIVSAEKNSFSEVTSKLDTGGSFYLYLSTEQFIANLKVGLKSGSNIIASLPTIPSDQRPVIGKVFGVIEGILNESGVADISGIGMSSIAREKHFYYNKVVLHHYKGQGQGPIWSLFGKTAHPLQVLDYLPADTAIAGSSDFDAPLMWTNIVSVVESMGVPDVSSGLNAFPGQFLEHTGLDWDAALKSLGTEYGAILTLDESKKVTLPLGKDTIEIPSPALCLIFKVNSDLIYDRINKALEANLMISKLIVKTDEPGLKMRTVLVPLPIPVEVRPSVARVGDYLLIASTDSLIRDMVAVKKGDKKGFKSTDTFKKLSEGVPLEGNNFSLVTTKLGQAFARLQENALEQAHLDSEALKNLHDLMETNSIPGAFSVGANGPEGWEAVGNGGSEGAMMVVLPAAAVGGMLAAIAMPNFVKARTTSQQNACINNLRLIDASKQQWALENKKQPTDVPTVADVKPYMGRGAEGEMPKCPQGGTYTIGAINEKPKCSIPGHELP